MSAKDLAAKIVRPEVQAMHAYAIQSSAGLVKLDAMENPFRLPATLQQQLGERLARVAINRYPVQCAADVVAAERIFGLKPGDVSHIQKALESGLGISSPAQVRLLEG